MQATTARTSPYYMIYADSVNDCYDYVCVYTCATKIYIWGHMIAYDQPRMGGSSSPTMPRGFRSMIVECRAGPVTSGKR